MSTMLIVDASHSSHLAERLWKMRATGELVDFVIRGHHTLYSVHSLVLAAVSPVFNAMVSTAMKEATSKEANFPIIPDDIMKMILEFAYQGTCTVTEKQLTDLTKAAHYLQITELLQLCEEKICAFLNPHNCIAWSRLGAELQLETVTDKAQEIMCSSFRDVTYTTDFKELAPEEIEQYLQDICEHEVSSDDLLHGALQWLNHNATERQEYIPRLFASIPISQCSSSYLSRVILDNADLFNMQKDVYGLILKARSERVIKREAIVVLGGLSKRSSQYDYNRMPLAIHLDKGDVVELPELKFDAVPHSSICQVPCGFLATGGLHSWLYVSSIKMWIKFNNLLCTRFRHSSVYCNGKVLLVGGEHYLHRCEPLDSKDRVHVLDFGNKQWTQGPECSKQMYDSTVVSLHKSVYVLFRSTGYLHELDTQKMVWAEKAPLPDSYITAYTGCSCAASEDRLYVTGGMEKVAFMYTPYTDTWSHLTAPSVTNWFGALVCHRHKLYFIPGSTDEKVVTDVQEYDIMDDKWTVTEWKLPVPIRFHSAFVLEL